jgi:hypothetical protein
VHDIIDLFICGAHHESNKMANPIELFKILTIRSGHSFASNSEHRARIGGIARHRPVASLRGRDYHISRKRVAEGGGCHR